MVSRGVCLIDSIIPELRQHMLHNIYIYIYIYTHTYIYIYIHICIHVHVHIYIYIYIYIYTHVYMCLIDSVLLVRVLPFREARSRDTQAIKRTCTNDSNEQTMIIHYTSAQEHVRGEFPRERQLPSQKVASASWLHPTSLPSRSSRLSTPSAREERLRNAYE